MASILLGSAGPLPLKTTVTAPSDDPITFFVSGSAYAANPNVTIGFALVLDGQQIGVAQIFANQAESHMAVVPIYIPWQFTEPGTHTLELVALPNTVTDYNDNYQITMIV